MRMRGDGAESEGVTRPHAGLRCTNPTRLRKRDRQALPSKVPS